MTTLARVPAELGSWKATGLRLPRDFLGSVSFSEWVHRRYQLGDESVDMFLGGNHRLRPHQSLISAKNAFPDSGWRVEEQRVTRLDPVISPEDRKAGKLTNSRAIIDACRPYHWKDEFPKVNAPTPEARREAWEKWGHLRD